MTNTIPIDQNEPLQLQRLAAQRQLYTSAKTALISKCILTIPVLFTLAIITFFFPTFKIWYAFYGICLLLINAVLLDPYEISLKRQAAAIQELFDCDVLHLSWPQWKLNAKPDPELIQRETTKYLNEFKDFSALQNWYPKQVEQLPLPLARLLCQRINLKYDTELRRYYTTRLLTIFTLVGIGIAFIGILNGLTIDTFILGILIPLSPLMIWGIDEYAKNSRAADHLEILKKLSEQLWNSGIKSPLTKEQLECESRDLQNEIFECRKNNPLVFDWLYNRLKESQEDQMNSSTDYFISEAIKNLKTDEIHAYD